MVKTIPHSHNLPYLSYLLFFLNLGVYQFYWFFSKTGFWLHWFSILGLFLLHYFLHFISSFYFVLWFPFGFLGWETGYWFATFFIFFKIFFVFLLLAVKILSTLQWDFWTHRLIRCCISKYLWIFLDIFLLFISSLILFWSKKTMHTFLLNVLKFILWPKKWSWWMFGINLRLGVYTYRTVISFW